MADRASPFSEAELAELRRLGFTAVAGYLGGHTPSPWSADDFRRALHHVGPVLPIWVLSPFGMDSAAGRLAGEHTVAAMRTMWRPGRGRYVVLDVEIDYYRGAPTLQAVEAWRETVVAGGYRPVLYSGASVIEAVTGHEPKPHHITAGWAGVWLAHWIQTAYRPAPQLLHMDTRWHSLARRRAWQYAGDVHVAGLVIDPSVTDMALNPAILP
jgi:hypothetical protein